MKKISLRAFMLVGALFASTSANAIFVSQWSVNVDTKFDPTSVNPNNSPLVELLPGDTQLRWGNCGVGDNPCRSGLNILNSPANNLVVTTDGPAVQNVGVEHLNRVLLESNPVTLVSVDILSTLTLTPLVPNGLPGLPPDTRTFKIKFAETPNNANPCADGGTPGAVGTINEFGCADIFVMDQNSLNAVFPYDDHIYFISFFDMSQLLKPLPALACAATGSSSPCLGWETAEQLDTATYFGILITSVPVRIDLPEPGSLALVGIALLGLGVARRRII